MYKATVSKDVGGLTMRSSPSASSKVIDEASPGDEVVVSDSSSSSAKGWLYVKYRGQWGWMASKYLVRAKEPAPPPLSPIAPPIWPSGPKPKHSSYGIYVGIGAAFAVIAAAIYGCFGP